MIATFIMTMRYLLSPSYRRKLDREYGWSLLFRAINYQLNKPTFDRADNDAARLMNQKMRELR